MANTSSSFVKDELNSYSHEVLSIGLDNLNDIQRSRILARYFTERILPTLGHSSDLIDQFDEGYVDGSNDLGNDVIIKIGNQVHLIQTKYISSRKSIENHIVESWHRTFERLGTYTGNKQVSEILRDIDWANDNFYLWFVTTGKIEGQASLAKESNIVIPANLKDKGLTIEQIESDFVEQIRLKEEIVNSKSSTIEVSKITASIYPIKVGSERSPIITFEEPESDLTTAVLVVDASQLVELYKNHKKSIFALNVRQFLGQTKKNKGIKESAQKEPQKFFFYNNGVSAVTEELIVHDDHISVTGLSIINGAQTVKSLFDANSPKEQQPKVLLRISEVRLKEKRLILDNIIRYNNTQNEIKNSDFRSNDFIQSHYAEQFQLLKRKGNICEYRPKRIERGRKAPDKLVIQLTDFAKYVYAFIEEPYTAESSGVTSLFSLEGGKSSNYEKIFGSKDEVISRDDFLYRAGIYFLATELLAQLAISKKTFTEPEKRDACERGTIIVYIASNILNRLEKDSPSFSKVKLLQLLANKPNWAIGDTDVLSQFVSLLYKRCEVTAFYCYKNEKLKKPPASLRSWQRGTDGTRDSLLAYIDISFEPESLLDKLTPILSMS